MATFSFEKTEEDKFREIFMASRYAPPETGKGFDPIQHTMSALAVAEVVNLINRQTQLKCWSEPENYGPDITVQDLGIIEVCNSHMGRPAFVPERKIKRRWELIGGKQIMLWLEVEPNGKMYWMSIPHLLGLIEGEEPIYGSRGNAFWKMDKELCSDSLAEMVDYLTEPIC